MTTVRRHTTIQEIEVSKSPVFIIGSPRSGTTALAAALAEHSHFWTGGESTVLASLFPPRRLAATFEWAHTLPASTLLTQGISQEEFMQHVGIGINALFTSRSDGRRWVDQTPAYALIAGQLLDMFPDARFIHILRDGRRVVHSMQHIASNPERMDVASSNDWLENEHFHGIVQRFGDFRYACRDWARHVMAAHDFQQRHPDSCLTVVNEMLLTKPEAEFQRIFRFLDVPYESAPVAYLGSHRVNSSFSKIWNEAVAPQVTPDPWPSWSVEQRSIFVQEAGKALVYNGLATKDDMDALRVDIAGARAREDEEYRQLVDRVRAIVDRTLSPYESVLVVSGGDDYLLHLGECAAKHFPQDESGEYSGHNPEDGAFAVQQLVGLCRQGARVLVIPRTAFWWFDSYPEFQSYLESVGTVLFKDETTCMIVGLDQEQTDPIIA
jgi:hypothetical protein